MATDSIPPTRLIRVTVFNTRKPELTNAQYIEHWLTTHQKLAAPWLIRAGFLEYKQVRLFNPTMRNGHPTVPRFLLHLRIKLLAYPSAHHQVLSMMASHLS
jgi:hypothetical protein